MAGSFGRWVEWLRAERWSRDRASSAAALAELEAELRSAKASSAEQHAAHVRRVIHIARDCMHICPKEDQPLQCTLPVAHHVAAPRREEHTRCAASDEQRRGAQTKPAQTARDQARAARQRSAARRRRGPHAAPAQTARKASARAAPRQLRLRRALRAQRSDRISTGASAAAASPEPRSPPVLRPPPDEMPHRPTASGRAAGVAPRIMGIGPVPATHKVMAMTGLSIEDMDVIEINEAFAAQGLACLRELGVADDASHVNPNGGAIALGHPLGMSGARLVLTAAYELKRRGGRYALCTMCVGVGQGVAMILEAC